MAVEQHPDGNHGRDAQDSDGAAHPRGDTAGAALGKALPNQRDLAGGKRRRLPGRRCP